MQFEGLTEDQNQAKTINFEWYFDFGTDSSFYAKC